MYTHGYNGYPYMYNSKRSVVWNTNYYNILNWTEDGTVYFHGCHTATLFIPDSEDIKEGITQGNYYPLQRFANYQNVETYGNKYGTSLSSNPTKHENIILNPSQCVYLRTYEIPKKEADGTDDPNLSYVPMKCFYPQ